MATLERREQTPGKVTYRVRWWADGKQRSKSFKSHTDARRWKAVLEGDLVNGTYLDPREGQVTVSSFISEHLDTLLMHVRASTRVRAEGIYVHHINPEFGHLPLTALSVPLVQGWVGRMRATMSAASVRKNVFALRKVCDLAVAHGLLRSNPVAGVRLPAEDKREQRFLTHTEAWALAEAILPRFKAMVLLAVFGGLRAGEIAALRRSCVSAERNTVTVKETVVDVKGVVSFGPPKTKTSVRVVTIPRSIMAELVAHMDAYTGSEPDALVFTGQRGVVIRRHWFYRLYWKPACDAVGLEGLRFHDLRHTFVALWVHAGRNPKEVSRAAGHSSVAFTLDRYGHLYDTDHDGLADELDSLLGHIRPHEVTRTAPSMLKTIRPPSSSGLGRRPFTASRANPHEGASERDSDPSEGQHDRD
jgi:integrase